MGTGKDVGAGMSTMKRKEKKMGDSSKRGY